MEILQVDSCEKIIVEQDYVFLMGVRYLRRVFSDNSAELIRYDEAAKLWVILEFDGDSW